MVRKWLPFRWGLTSSLAPFPFLGLCFLGVFTEALWEEEQVRSFLFRGSHHLLPLQRQCVRQAWCYYAGRSPPWPRWTTSGWCEMPSNTSATTTLLRVSSGSLRPLGGFQPMLASAESPPVLSLSGLSLVEVLVTLGVTRGGGILRPTWASPEVKL